MRSCYLLLVVLCSTFIIQNANSSLLKTNQITPTNYSMALSFFPGILAKDIGIGNDGTMWRISNQQSYANFAIFCLKPNSTTWEKIPGQASRVSVCPDGLAWVVTSEKRVFKWNPTFGRWDIYVDYGGPGGVDVSCSPDGKEYYVGGDGGLYMLNKDGQTWKKLNGNGTCIAGGLCQSAWYLGSDKQIYKTIPGTWKAIAGQATDVAVGANGQTWLLTADAVPNQFAVWDENRQALVTVPLADYLTKSGQTASFGTSPTVRIAVAPNGDLIGVKEDFTMFRLSFKYTL